LINAGFQADLSGLQGTISRFTDKAIFINVSGSVDGVVWPLHYADIQLKHPEKRFKAGNTVKCRVSPVNRRQKSLPDVGVSAVASRSSPSSRKRAVSSSR
jgi:transcriptional accessory protein Tex/SPT6